MTQTTEHCPRAWSWWVGADSERYTTECATREEAVRVAQEEYEGAYIVEAAKPANLSLSSYFDAFRFTEDAEERAYDDHADHESGDPLLELKGEHIIDQRVERLNEISEDDAIEEGGRPFFDHAHLEPCRGPNGFEHQMAPLRGPREDFERIWEQLHGRGAWWKDPWVQVLRFRVSLEHIDTIRRAG